MKKILSVLLSLLMLLTIGVVNVSADVVVAKIGDKEYSSIQNAINESKSGDVISIVKEGTYAIPSPIDGVTINGNSAGGKEKVIFDISSGSGQLASTSGEVGFENITFNFGNNGYTGFQQPGTINFTNCNINGLFFSYGSMNFTDCVFTQTNNDYSMWCYAGDVTYTRCTFNEKKAALNLYNEGNNAKDADGKVIPWVITIDNCNFVYTGEGDSPYAGILLKTIVDNVSDERCKKTAYTLVLKGTNTASSNWKGTKASGSGQNPSTSKLVGSVDGLVWVQQAESDISSVVENGTQVWPKPLEPVAQIGDKKYNSLNAAIADIADSTPTTIEILCNVNNAAGISIPEGRVITIDFGGHDYVLAAPGAGSSTTETNGFQLLKDSTITFKNGNISCAEENKTHTWVSSTENKPIRHIIQNYSNLTLDNMTLDGSNSSNNNGTKVPYTISNNHGEVIIKDTKIVAHENGFAFDSCKYASYDKPTVTVKDNSEIIGKVEATGGNIVFESSAKLNGQLRVGENKNGGSTGSIVTIKNGATITSGEYPVVVFGENTLNVSGKVESTTESTDDTAAIATNGNGYNAGSKIYINEGAEVSSKRGSGIYMPNGSLTIKGGTITGPTAVYFKSTDLSISGGTLIGNGQKKGYVFNGNGGNPTGDALVVDNCNYPSGINTPVVSGGQFKSINASPIGSYKGNGKDTILTGFVGGGIFNKEFDSSLVVSGKHIIANTDTETLNEYPYAVGELNIPEKTVTETSKKSDVPSYPAGSEKKKVADNLGKMSIDLDAEALKLVSNKVNESFVNNARQRIGLQIEENLDVNVRTVLKTEVLSTNLTPASASKKTFKIDITPVYEILIKKEGATGDGTKVDEGIINVNRSVMVKVYLPEGFATTGEEHVWIKHWLHGGSSKVCEVVVANDTDGNYVEFENHYGFSAFEFFLEQVYEDAAPNHDSTSHYRYLVPNTGIR